MNLLGNRFSSRTVLLELCFHGRLANTFLELSLKVLELKIAVLEAFG